MGGGYSGGNFTPPEERFVSVSVNSGSDCGIKADGSIGCWRAGNEWAAPPEGEFVSIDVHSHHGCGVRTDGSVACRGDDQRSGLAKAAPQEGEFVSVSVGNVVSCGLRADVIVMCWGGDIDYDGRHIAPQSNIVNVTASIDHVCLYSARSGPRWCSGEPPE